MNSRFYTFPFKTGEITIDYKRCAKCKNYACVKADSLFGTNVLRIQNKKPVLTTNPDDVKRLCNECLTCELYCEAYGNGGLRIKIDMYGLDEYREKRTMKYENSRGQDGQGVKSH